MSRPSCRWKSITKENNHDAYIEIAHLSRPRPSLSVVTLAVLALIIIINIFIIVKHDWLAFRERSPFELKNVPGVWPPSRTFLDKIADTDGRLTVVGVNWGYMDMFLLWQERALAAGVHNYVIMAYDQESYTSLKDTGRALFPMVGLFHTAKTTASKYGSVEFNTLTRTRPTMLQAILDMNYTVHYSDIDTAYRRNPYEVFESMLKTDPDLDIIISEDGCDDLWCSCQLYLRPRPNTFRFMSRWKTESVRDRDVDDQAALNRAKDGLLADGDALRYGLVPSWMFPSGKTMFQNANYDWEQHPEGPTIVHANWMIGHVNKMIALRNTSHWDSKP